MSVKLQRARQSAPDERDIDVSPANALALAVIAPATPEREALIAVAAYYRAERRGFAPGAEMDDWLGAEQDLLGKERPL